VWAMRLGTGTGVAGRYRFTSRATDGTAPEVVSGTVAVGPPRAVTAPRLIAAR